jgi:hypothetical protein
MSIRYNHKGKYFTEIETKIRIEAIIQTTQQRIQGTLHIHPDRRLLDELNEPPEFLAVTGARICESNDPIQTGFLAIHKRHILWVTPIEDVIQEDAHDN